MLVGESLTASGSYAMLSVALSPCLQLLSDSLVNATAQYVSAAAKDYIPSWIYDLPEAEQQLKIDMIHAYGSPNVFSAFEPHVTLAVDSANTTELAAVVAANPPGQEVVSPILDVGFGSVGPYGSVLQNQDVLPPVTIFPSSSSAS
ncbi:hypothetical protein TeGR_g8206 [Tetraparma gracilis]|uniref:Uncharacterized protein n=1 Tax=Tetraparma gracilis TaxID=2962635 RepID=A0ABQ6N3V2_9STRA|nr:hypothetical protein TeGR_g8206 [Tetraparma gracilis]